MTDGPSGSLSDPSIAARRARLRWRENALLRGGIIGIGLVGLATLGLSLVAFAISVVVTIWL